MILFSIWKFIDKVSLHTKVGLKYTTEEEVEKKVQKKQRKI